MYYQVQDRDGEPIEPGDTIVSWHGTPATFLSVIFRGRAVLVSMEGQPVEYLSEVFGLHIEIATRR
jgi:hypothetical protein